MFTNLAIVWGPHFVLWMKEIMKSDQPPKGWLKLYKSWDVYQQLVQDFATIHSMNGT